MDKYEKVDLMESDINYSALIDKARTQVNNNAFQDSQFNCNLARLSPKIDKISKISLYAIISFNHYTNKNENKILPYIKKSFKFLKQNKRINNDEVSYTIVRVINRGILFYHGKQK